MATIFVLARHGETDWNLEHRLQGHSDRPLNAAGRQQAEELADRLAGDVLDAIYASDLARAHATAFAVAERRGLPVHVVPALRERDFGSWEGLTDREILARFPDATRGSWGDGETREDLGARVVRAIFAIASDHVGGRVLVVTHGGTIAALLREAGPGDPGIIGNGAVIRVLARDGRLEALD